MRTIMFYRDAAAGDGGGTPNVGPTLEYIMDNGLESDGMTLKAGWQRDSITGAVTRIGGNPAPAPQAPGSGTPAPSGTNPTPPAEPKPAEPKPDEPKPPVEGLNEDGTLKEGYIKNEDGSIGIDPAYEPDPNAEFESFYGNVDKLNGIELAFDAPDGIEIGTPEYQAARENAIRQQEQVAFDNFLREAHPRAYAYFMHQKGGGTDAEFFEKAPPAMPTLDALKGSADIQSAVYKQDLMKKGLEEDVAQAAVDAAVKGNKLLEKAEAIWNAADKQGKDFIAAQELKDQQEAKKFNDDKIAVVQNIQKTINDEMSFHVPEAKKREFNDFVLSNLRYDDGKFFMMQELGDKSLKSIIETLFFQYNKGDLSTLVRKQAGTQVAQKLRLRTNANGPKPGAGANHKNNASGNIPLGQHFVTQ